MNTEFVKEIFGLNGIVLSDEKYDKFAALAELLKRFNEKVNITSVSDDTGIAVRHFADSLVGTADIFKNVSRETLADVGAGGGFPSLPLAIAYDNVFVTSIDSTAKKLVFVLEAAKELGLGNIRTISARAEDLSHGPEHRENYDYVCARAVGSLRIISELCIPLVKKNGLFIAYKGPDYEAEIADAKGAFVKLGGTLESSFKAELLGEDDKKTRALVMVRKTGKTEDKYPRNYSQIKKKPL